MREFVRVVAGISGVPIPVGGVLSATLQWNAYLVDAIMLFAQSGVPADTAQLSIAISDEKNRVVFQDNEGGEFAPALALMGIGPSLFFPGAPRWYRTRRTVKQGDQWIVRVQGTAGIVPILGFHLVELPGALAAECAA